MKIAKIQNGPYSFCVENTCKKLKYFLVSFSILLQEESDVTREFSMGAYDQAENLDQKSLKASVVDSYDDANVAVDKAEVDRAISPLAAENIAESENEPRFDRFPYLEDDSKFQVR